MLVEGIATPSLKPVAHSVKNKKAQLSLTNPHDKNCSNSTCSQRCRRQYWSIFIRLAVVASEICEIPSNSLKIQTYTVQDHPRSSILMSIESAYPTVEVRIMKFTPYILFLRGKFHPEILRGSPRAGVKQGRGV